MLNINILFNEILQTMESSTGLLLLFFNNLINYSNSSIKFNHESHKYIFLEFF